MDQAADKYTPAMAQWGIPDPRQTNGYPGDKAPMAQWAWEFLRRRDDYRRQWLTTIAPYLSADGEFDDHAFDRAMEPVRRLAMATRQGYRIEQPIDALMRDFSLHTGNIDPRRRDRPMFEAHFISFKSWLSEQRMREQERPPEMPPMSPWPLGEYECTVTFNVSLPLEPQFEAARNILQDFVRKVPPDRLVQPSRPRPRTFAGYLRTLDFDAAGEMEAIIGEHLFPKLTILQRRAAVRDLRAAAKAWQRDYLSLVATAKRRD